ncbi:MAG: hypothetical protein KAX40_05490 [Herpetosiphon sp.]|nr:hypothetical protein [Herpetosiphon sp.]
MKKSLLALVIGLIILIVALTHSTNSVTADVERINLINKTQNSINYQAYFDTQQQTVYGNISYDYVTKQGVQAYLDYNRSTIETLTKRPHTTIFTNVVFNRPLSETEFIDFVKSYADNVLIYSMRSVESDGKRVTLFGAPEGNDIVPHQILDTMLRDSSEHNAALFMGWIEVKITTNSQTLAQIMADPRVFTVEVAHTLIHDELTPAKLKQRNIPEQARQRIAQGGTMDVQITAPSLYWNLEDTGFIAVPEYRK